MGLLSSSTIRLCLTSSLMTIMAVVLVMIPGSPAQNLLVQTFHWVGHQDKFEGSLMLAATYAASVILMVPGTPFNLAAGFLFGAWRGAPVAFVGALVGGILSFFLGRTLAREWAEKTARQHSRFRAIDIAIQRNGFKIVFLMRLSPLLPYPLLSYIFGITQVNTVDYVAGTIAGLIPVAIMESMIGAEMKSLTNAVSGSHSRGSTLVWVTFVIATTALILLFVTYFTQDAIHSAMQDVDTHGNRYRTTSSSKK